MLADATPSTRLADLTAAVPAYVVDDIGGQMRLAEEPLASFRALPRAAKVCGPVFAGSTDIGGADADYILDGLLLDCKAARDPRRLGHKEIYQLARLPPARLRRRVPHRPRRPLSLPAGRPDQLERGGVLGQARRDRPTSPAARTAARPPVELSLTGRHRHPSTRAARRRAAPLRGDRFADGGDCPWPSGRAPRRRKQRLYFSEPNARSNTPFWPGDGNFTPKRSPMLGAHAGGPRLRRSPPSRARRLSRSCAAYPF